MAIKIATHNTPELKVLQRVRHKNIVHFYGAIEKVGYPSHIVMGKLNAEITRCDMDHSFSVNFRKVRSSFLPGVLLARGL